MENQNASAEYPHIPAKGSLQAALPMAAPCRPCSGGRAWKAPVWMGGVLFLQIAAFLLREGGRVSPATLECRLI